MNRQEENTTQRLKDLAAIQLFKTSEAYKILIDPLLQEIERMKYSYDCETVNEMAELRGKRQGLMFLIDLMNSYTQAGIRAEETQQQLERKKVLNDMEIDSTTL